MRKRKISSSRAGQIAELEFATAAMYRGFNIAFTPGDILPYDILLDNGKRVYKIQVKCSFLQEQNSRFHITCNKHEQGSYTSKDTDFIAVFLKVPRIWYILPVKEVSKTLGFDLYPISKKSKYNKYKEAWDLLKWGYMSNNKM